MSNYLSTRNKRRHITATLLAGLLIVSGLCNYVFTDSFSRTVAASPIVADDSHDAVALSNTEIFNKTGDPAKDGLIDYFQKQSNKAQITTVAQPFVYRPSTNGAGQATEIIAKSQARFLTAFQDQTGVKINVYQSTIGKPTTLVVDANFVATMWQFVVDHAAEANSGYLSAGQINRLQDLAKRGQLDYITMNIVISASPDTCNDQLIPVNRLTVQWKDGRTCDTQGTYFPLDIKGYSSLPIVQTTTVALFSGQSTYPTTPSERLALEKKATTTLAHELAHALADISGLRGIKLAAGMNEDALDKMEHHNFVDNLDQKIEQTTDYMHVTGIDIQGNSVTTMAPRIPFSSHPVSVRPALGHVL